MPAKQLIMVGNTPESLLYRLGVSMVNRSYGDISMNQINKFTTLQGRTNLLKGVGVKLKAANELNNQNISSINYVYIAETLELMDDQSGFELYSECLVSILDIIELSMYQLQRPDIIMEERIITGALISLLESLVIIVKALEVIEIETT